ncbi:Zinc finger protein VAR3, chloroplastic [Dichanthelium oligosanthes]|uniref:Zinc finger protein VAR3, chloroplastic n=1 Tax=Dichanthelium oligosanthes TaxID=888268 RepID=A0A1E5UKX6_9POAL|nr:Zinc finger protein VAR3, chloroplastic [Dichanthelium oligosanthes]
MAYHRPSLLLRRRRSIPTPSCLLVLLRHRPFASSPSPPPPPLPASSKPPALSARLAFVFDQLDAIDRSRSSDLSARDAALRRIQSWRRPAPPPEAPPLEGEPGPGREPEPLPDEPKKEAEAAAVAAADEVGRMSMEEVLRREVELVHPWPEWIELMERLAQQRYFDLGRAGGADEASMAAAVPMDLSEVSEEVGFDFSRDWTTVKNACMNFGRDRSLPRKDLQILVGHGCPSMDAKAVFSAKLIRKLVHLDEGDVCSSCNLRNVCSKGYILTRKEDEARTLDVMRILLIYGFDHIKETVENKPLLKLKSLKTVVRKLIHEIVKLSAVPIDPNLPPPVIRKPPPKVKQPPPPPKKRVGRDDVEMKKGDWLCPKCDFMNFAKNTICLQCDAKRPKRQLLPGEWECPRCNFLNYRRNMSCFHCEHDRPADEYAKSQMEAKQSALQKRLERPPRKSDVSSAWNFDFDDNESDGADVAAFEFADSSKARESSSVDNMSYRDSSRGSNDKEFRMAETMSKGRDNKFSERESLPSSTVSFDDFDDEEEDDIDSYELDLSKGSQKGGVSRMSYSDLENASDSEGFGEFDNSRKSRCAAKDDITVSADEDEFEDHPSLRSSHLADSWHKTRGRSGSNKYRRPSFGSESDDGINSDLDEDIDKDLRSKRNCSQGNPDRASVRHNALAYSDDESFPDDMGSGMVDQFQSRRTKSSTNISDNFRGRSRSLNERQPRGDRYSRTKRNEQSNGFDMHRGGEVLDRSRRVRGNQLDNGSRGSQRNVRGNWDRSGDFNGRRSGFK